MTKEMKAPAWRRAFLRELARSGSVALAAERCGIDRSTAYQVRKANAAFAASWERALAKARASLDGTGAGRVRLRGDEVVRASKAGRPCVVRAGPGRWSVTSERVFLDELTASANVRAAARAAGVSPQAAYNRRRLWPAFAAAWGAAKAEGYVRIEMLLIHAATATLDPGLSVEARADGYGAPEMTIEQAMKLWFHGAGRERGKPLRHDWRLQEPDIEEVRAEILRRLAAMDRAKARGRTIPGGEAAG